MSLTTESNALLETSGRHLQVMVRLLDQARIAGAPADVVARIQQSYVMLSREWDALSQQAANGVNPELLARIRGLTERIRTAEVETSRTVDAAQAGMPWRKLLWVAVAIAATGTAAWGVWKWSQRDRY